MKDTLRIGYIVKPQGVRGQMKVEPLSDNPERFYELTEANIQTSQGKDIGTYSIDSCAVRGGFAYITLEGITDRSDVEALRSCYICVAREKAVALPEGHHFICDLLGSDIMTTTGQSLGKLQNILQNGAADVYVVSGERSCMFPALDRLIVLVDTEEKKITVRADVLEEVAVWDET